MRAYAEVIGAPAGSPKGLRLPREALSLELAAGGDGSLLRSNLIDFELVAGGADAATKTGKALLAELAGGDKRALAYTRINFAAAWLRLGGLPRAHALAQADWPQGRLFGLQLYWADHRALLAAREVRPREDAWLAGYADAGYAARAESRQPNEAAAHAQACTLARTALGDAEFERLQAEGRGSPTCRSRPSPSHQTTAPDAGVLHGRRSGTMPVPMRSQARRPQAPTRRCLGRRASARAGRIR